ncbi:hypothetical protein ABIF81_005764 [Bradyrhizobium daqingense]
MWSSPRRRRSNLSLPGLTRQSIATQTFFWMDARVEPAHDGLFFVSMWLPYATDAFTFTGCTARNAIAILFQALMAAISIVRFTVSSSENCARTCS